MPATHRADLKRPDFLVAIDGLGAGVQGSCADAQGRAIH
jgi:hypothetical protein